ncbi:hypothetical protein QSH93_25280, partial [Escherichia coli]|uniref:hypothetical protein n=1 Tax=Escherichia coli TaxID=562 RepID=UPI00256EEE98
VQSNVAPEDENRAFRADIDARTREHFLGEVGLVELGHGIDAYERATALIDTLERELGERIVRYNDLRERGLDAVSDYDLGIVYGGEPVV